MVLNGSGLFIFKGYDKLLIFVRFHYNFFW
nr:MAG TPA: hypothetical protein [Caudoviricetes sp.]